MRRALLLPRSENRNGAPKGLESSVVRYAAPKISGFDCEDAQDRGGRRSRHPFPDGVPAAPHPWEAIGLVLGTSRQGAHRKYANRS